MSQSVDAKNSCIEAGAYRVPLDEIDEIEVELLMTP